MRDFLEYVEKSKEDSPTTIDFYMEGFFSDMSKMNGMDPKKTFIIGFLAGKGIDIKSNRQKIMDLISDKDIEITSASEAITNLKLEDQGFDVTELRKSLANVLASLRNLLKDHKDKDDSTQPTLFDVNKYRK